MTEAYGSAAGHHWGAPEITAATCTENGSEKKTCTLCGTFTRTIRNALGHSFGEYASQADGTHAALCLNGCGEKLTEACTPADGAPCPVCGYQAVPAEETPAAQESAAEDVPAAVIPLPEEAEVTYAAPEAAPQETDIIQLVVEPLAQPDEENAAPLSPALAAFQVENPRAQIMDISLLVNGEEARPAQKLRIALPVADEIPQGMKLVFINALGCGD